MNEDEEKLFNRPFSILNDFVKSGKLKFGQTDNGIASGEYETKDRESGIDRKADEPIDSNKN